MKGIDWVFMILISLGLITTSLAVLIHLTARDPHHTLDKFSKQTLPQKCQVFYNDGTDRWRECMGVEYK